MNFGLLWVSLSSSVCHIKNEREGGQRIFQMESSEEGTADSLSTVTWQGHPRTGPGARRHTGCCLTLQWVGGLAEPLSLTWLESRLKLGHTGAHAEDRQFFLRAVCRLGPLLITPLKGPFCKSHEGIGVLKPHCFYFLLKEAVHA